MRYGLLNLLFVLMLSTAAVAQGTPAMGKSMAFPQAGIELTLPSGFSLQKLQGANEVMVATRTESGQAAQSVSLLLYVADPDQTPTDIAKALLAPIKSDLALRHVKLEKSIPVTVAGLKGHANYLAYVHRGTPTEAIQLCFLREVKQAGQKPFHLAYVMTMEVAAAHKDKLLQTLDAVLKTIRLRDLKHPLQEKIQFRGDFHKDFIRRFAIRIPEGFYVLSTPTGINIAQNDYLAGGWPNPNVVVASLIIPGGKTAKECGEKAIAFDKEKAGLKVDILSQGPVKLNKKEGYEFILKKTLAVKTPTTSSQPASKSTPAPENSKRILSVIEVQRLLCVPSIKNPNKQRHFAIIMTCRGVSPKKAKEFMDALCKSFELLNIAKTTNVSSTRTP